MTIKEGDFLVTKEGYLEVEDFLIILVVFIGETERALNRFKKGTIGD